MAAHPPSVGTRKGRPTNPPPKRNIVQFNPSPSVLFVASMATFYVGLPFCRDRSCWHTGFLYRTTIGLARVACRPSYFGGAYSS